MLYSKQIKAQLKTAISTPEQRWSAITTLIITIIIVTPLCGFLFQCGCDWPWTGLDSHCNFYKPHAQHHCPWCESMFTGILSTGLAIIAGVLATTISLRSLSYGHLVSEISVRTVLGIMVFVLVAVLSAGVAAFLQDYPLGYWGLILF